MQGLFCIWFFTDSFLLGTLLSPVITIFTLWDSKRSSHPSHECGRAQYPPVFFHVRHRGQSMEIVRGAKMLAEGNVFKEMSTVYAEQAITEIGGKAYVPFTPEQTKACQSALGRPCVANQEIDPLPGAAPIVYGKTLAAISKFGVSHTIFIFEPGCVCVRVCVCGWVDD